MIFLLKKNIIIILFLFTCFLSSPSILVKQNEDQSIPAYKFFQMNAEFMHTLNFKKITVAEYLTDPLILYISLWGCISLSLPLHEEFWSKDVNGNYMSFNLNPLLDSQSFLNRMKMEPFASGRIDTVTTSKTIYDKDNKPTIINVLNLDFYSKNLVEPVYFTEMTLYLRSKNYHPALMIFEIFAMSVLYEFTIRPFFMNSNFEQLLKNPGIGLVCGILIDELSTFLLSTPYIGLHVLAYLLNPFNALPVARVHSLLLFDAFTKSASIEAVIKL
jgi:hypothetical protein